MWVDEADKRAATTIGALLPSPVPTPRTASPYETIAATLREHIRSGALQPGDELPTVAELAVMNTVAVGTAHRALAALKAEGLVTASRSRRATVSSPAAASLVVSGLVESSRAPSVDLRTSLERLPRDDRNEGSKPRPD